MSKQKFIEKLVSELKESEVQNIPFLVSVVEQQVHEFVELYEDINKYDFSIHNYQKDNYTNGKIDVIIEKPENQRESDLLIDAYFDYHYTIHFVYDDRPWGYCTCSPEDKGYNKEHKCCGNGCDWYAPAIYVEKVMELGQANWYGNEADYWKYEEDFYKTSEEQQRENEIKKNEDRKQYILKIINDYEKELKDIDYNLEILK